jgi:hypothetical protein
MGKARSLLYSGAPEKCISLVDIILMGLLYVVEDETCLSEVPWRMLDLALPASERLGLNAS